MMIWSPMTAISSSPFAFKAIARRPARLTPGSGLELSRSGLSWTYRTRSSEPVFQVPSSAVDVVELTSDRGLVSRCQTRAVRSAGEAKTLLVTADCDGLRALLVEC